MIVLQYYRKGSEDLMDEETFESLEIKLVKTAYVYQVKKAFSHFYLPTHRLAKQPSALLLCYSVVKDTGG
jgi:hypothetical protein